MSEALKAERRDRGLARHLEGWQVGAILVGVGLLSALLAVPRAVAPERLPLPRVDAEDLRADMAEERALARQARQQGLSFEARTVGEYLRRLGNAEYASRGLPAPGLADRLADVRGSVAGFRRARGRAADQELVRLRAIQGELFVDALAGRGAPADSQALAGAFGNAPAHGPWFRAGRFVGDAVEARLLFKARWNRVTGLEGDPVYALHPNEWLALLRFLLQHPEGSDARAQTRSQLATLEVLSKRQPEYPIAFARGTLLYRDGAYDLAAVAFQEHLAAHPAGDWSLRARNHLLAARERRAAQRAE
ncbi:MAG: hypothetical protein KC766_32770 [Myxococcales bacterium]|nr:hypothetical protein [Myxococcales bacterium]